MYFGTGDPLLSGADVFGMVLYVIKPVRDNNTV